MSKITQKALRLGDEEKNYFNDWNELIYYFPEIKLVRKNNILVGIKLPPNSQNVTFVNLNNRVYILTFTIPRSHEELQKDKSKSKYRTIKYESPLATKSTLMDLIRG